MCFNRAIWEVFSGFERRRARVHSSPPWSARSQEADEVRHIAAAEEQPTATDRIANELGDPSYGLGLDLGGGWRERPCADVRVYSRGEKITENPKRRRRRGDVSEETRVSIEE